MQAWIEVRGGAAQERIPWQGRLRLGAAPCEVVAPSPDGGELHLWSEPARLVFVGSGGLVLLNGRAVEEAPLNEGDTIQWGGLVVVVHPPAALEELAPEPAPPASRPVGRPGSTAAAPVAAASTSAAQAASRPPVSSGGSQASQRLLAGLAAECGMGDKAAVKRWQAAVLRGEWDPDAAAREILQGTDPEAAALLERASRVQRDLLMSAFQRGMRGAARKARGAARGGSAFVVANVVAVSVYSLLVAALAVLLRARYGWSLDGGIDGLLELVGGLFGGS
ncbi:MAG: hypothetical protein ISQ08_06965 [Planctomycetes bacterium]|nr:hypothetical protein [Planctomycetota bacterium]